MLLWGWKLLVPYLFAGVPAFLLARWIWRTQDKIPASAFIGFCGFAAILLLFALIDSDRTKDLPQLQLGADVYGIRGELRELRKDLVGYETEVIRGRDLTAIWDTGERESGQPVYMARLTLKYAAVPDSVLLWEGVFLRPPTNFTVNGRIVEAKTPLGPEDWKTDADFAFVVRYLKTPQGAGLGARGLGSGGLGS